MTTQKKVSDSVPALSQAPESREVQAIEEAKERVKARSPRLQMKASAEAPRERGKSATMTRTLGPGHSDLKGFTDRFVDAFGTTSQAFAETEINRLMRGLGPHWTRPPTDQEINAALAVVDGIRPENEVEALLAAQMVMTHVLTMQAMSRAHWAEEVEKQQIASNVAIRFGRLFTLQVEALAKLRRKGEQMVRVEHVHVHPGGQAIVGPVNTGGDGGG
jgi:hypothetical protein